MKRILLFFFAITMVLGWTSCGKNDYLAFVGTWGVDQIDYYNIDFYGQPIESTRETYHFTPGDPDHGIDLVFRADRTGEMRDRSRDTLSIPVYDELNNPVDTVYIINPDTTVVTKYTYSFHNDDAILYMNMEALLRYYRRTTVNDVTQDNLEEVERRYTYMMHIELLTDESFIYENEYDVDYVEKARLIRLSNEAPAKKATRSSKPVRVPHKPGSMFGNH